MSEPVQVADLLRQIAGVMTNPIRRARETCEVCTTPVDGYELCYQCNQTRHLHTVTRVRGWPTRRAADLVVPLTYAVMGQQAYLDMKQYKDAGGNEAARRRLSILLALFTSRHARCVDRAVGLPVTSVALVPSLAGRIGAHPLELIARFLPAWWRRIPLAAAADLPAGQNARREANPAHFTCQEDLAGEHVVVFDDSWVQGGHVQGAAVRLREAGAEKVTIVALARVLDPRWEASREFIRQHVPGPAYSLGVCPVTGGQCPP